MSVFNNLLPASFNNVNFLVPSENKSGGKKTVSHEYAGSDRRYVEELGENSPTYSVTAIITGSNAIQRRIRLEDELKKTGRGLLIHPTLGQLMVVALDYSSSSSDDKIGEFTFDISFSESDENKTLTPDIFSVQSISSLISQAKSELDSEFVNSFINTSLPSTITGTANQLTSVLNEVSDFASGVSDINTLASSVLSLNISKTLNSVATIARQGGTIASQIRQIYNQVENISDDIPSFFASWLGLSDFGLDRKKKSLTTQKRITEENNLSAVENHTQLNALLGLYESASYTEYSTDEELIQTQETLDEKYSQLVDNASDDSIAFSSEFRELISQVRVKSREILEDKAQNVWRVVDINPNETSMLLTSYRYYGDIKNLDTIIDLNPLVNVSISDEVIKGIS